MLFRSGPPEEALKATARDFLRILLDPGSIARLHELCTEIKDRLADASPARLSADPERENAANASAVATSRQLRASGRSAEHTSEIQSLIRSSYAVFCLKKKN